MRKHKDVGTILELAATYGHADLFNELVRTGTATWKVYSTLKRLNKGDEGFRQLEEEFSLQMNLLREQLATLNTNADDETLKVNTHPIFFLPFSGG